MSVKFATGSEDKFREAQAVIPSLERIDIDLPEIQELDPHKVIAAKIKVAFEELKQPLVVEDTSLYFDNMKGLPGPLIKWFLKSIGIDGLVDLATAFSNNKAQAKTIVGYTEDGEHITFYEGVVGGSIVKPRGDKGFGWDPIFEVEELNKTFAELELEEKTKYSMRRIAFQKLAEAIP